MSHDQPHWHDTVSSWVVALLKHGQDPDWEVVCDLDSLTRSIRLRVGFDRHLLGLSVIKGRVGWPDAGLLGDLGMKSWEFEEALFTPEGRATLVRRAAGEETDA